MDRDRRLVVRLGAGVVLAVLLSAIWTIAAQAPLSSSDSRSIVFVMELAATREGGATGADSAAVTPRLVTGQPYTRYFETGDGSLCTVASVPKPTLLGLPYQWKVDAELVSVGSDSAIVEVTWSRLMGGDAGGHRRITLKRGDQHVLDFLSSSEGRCPNAVLRVRLPEAQGDQGGEQVLAYDLWLSQRNAAGREQVRHLEAFARDEESHRFRFEPVRWNFAGEYVEQSPRPGVEMHVSGVVTSRLQPDGRIELTLRTSREFESSLGKMGGHGVKVVSVRPGEPLSVALPPPGGQVEVGPSEGLDQGTGSFVTNGNGRFISLKHFFAGSSTTLVITVRKAQ